MNAKINPIEMLITYCNYGKMTSGMFVLHCGPLLA